MVEEDKNSNIVSSPSAVYVAEWALKFRGKKSTFDYDYLEKTKKNFKIANKRLYRNCKIQIRKDKNLTYFTFNRKKSKWIKKGEAKFLYRMCVDFGEKAFFDE